MFMQGAEEGPRSSSFEMELFSAAAHSQARQEQQRRVKQGNGARERDGVCCERECAAVGEQMDPRVRAGGEALELSLAAMVIRDARGSTSYDGAALVQERRGRGSSPWGCRRR